jgi:hypothetical protein
MRMTFLGRICRRNKTSERSSTMEMPTGAKRFPVKGVKEIHNHGRMSAVGDGTLIHRGWGERVRAWRISQRKRKQFQRRGEVGEPTNPDPRRSKESQGGCIKIGRGKIRGRGRCKEKGRRKVWTKILNLLNVFVVVKLATTRCNVPMTLCVISVRNLGIWQRNAVADSLRR